jgi:hypothetical protein
MDSPRSPRAINVFHDLVENLRLVGKQADQRRHGSSGPIYLIEGFAQQLIDRTLPLFGQPPDPVE